MSLFVITLHGSYASGTIIVRARDHDQAVALAMPKGLEYPWEKFNIIEISDRGPASVLYDQMYIE